MESITKTVVSSLLGHGNVPLALRCYESLVRNSAEPIALRLHDDGSLTAEDRAVLADRLPVCEFVSRLEADRRMGPILRGRPALGAYRTRHPLGLKLLDAPLWATGEPPSTFLFVDSDVLFVRAFRGLFDLPSGVDAVFMRDYQDAYSLRSWQLLFATRWRPLRRVNTGIVVFESAGYDLTLLEEYFARPGVGFSPGWMEQTAWALLAGVVRTRLLDRRQFMIPRGVGDLARAVLRDAIGLHFVTPARRLIEGLDLAGQASEPVVVRTEGTARCRPWHLAQGELRRAWGRIASATTSGGTAK